jgi:hypothetical protein
MPIRVLIEGKYLTPSFVVDVCRNEPQECELVLTLRLLERGGDRRRFPYLSATDAKRHLSSPPKEAHTKLDRFQAYSASRAGTKPATYGLKRGLCDCFQP